MNRSNYIRILLLFVAFLLPSPTLKASVEESLESFNRNETEAAANRFFSELLSCHFINEPVSMKSGSPKDSLRAKVWYWAAEWFYDKQQYDKSLNYGEKALPISKGTSIESDCLNLMAIANIRISDFDKAAWYAKQCYAKDEASGDPDLMSSSLNTLAAIYLSAKQPFEAEKYVLRGIEMAEKADNPSRMAVLQGMASEIYHAQGDDDKALKYIEKAYEIDTSLGNEPKAMVRLAQKAAVLIGLDQFSEAEKVLQKVIPYMRKSGNLQSLGISCNKMGYALASQHRVDEAVPYYREAAKIFVKLGDAYNEMHARRGLCEALWKKAPDEAKIQHDRFNTLKDSLYDTASAESLARYNAEFGNNLLQLENKAQRSAKWQAICLAAIIAVIAIVGWLVMRRRASRQAVINEELRRNIQMLNEKYKQLNIYYDNALQLKEQDDNDNLTLADRDFIERAVNTINQLINEGSPDAASVAKRMGMSLFQFRQRLSKVVDETPQSFIQMVRMRRARHLLDNHHELNINEVAMLCAYNDTPNFTRAFKKTYGLTPTQYVEKRNV